MRSFTRCSLPEVAARLLGRRQYRVQPVRHSFYALQVWNSQTTVIIQRNGEILVAALLRQAIVSAEKTRTR